MGTLSNETKSIMKDLFDWLPNRDAREARDEGLERVETNAAEWFPAAMKIVQDNSISEPFTGEDLRHAIVDRIGPPHHNNAFGAVVAQAKRRGLLEETGNWPEMKDKQSHARRTPEYRWAR